MKTNEQTNQKQLTEDARESIIVKGIANSLLSMHFPKIKNLEEMLSYFDYEITIKPKEQEYDNLVMDFLTKNRYIKDTFRGFDLDLSKKNRDHKFSCVYDGLLKKITLCETLVSEYINHIEDSLDTLVGFDCNHKRYFDIICFLSERKNVLAVELPIWQYNDKTYSVDELYFKDENDLYSYFYQNTSKTIFIYQVKILKNNTIEIRYNVEK